MWNLTNNVNVDFLVKDTCEVIDGMVLPHGMVETRWNRLVSIKVNTFRWIVILNSLPTKDNLISRGIDAPSSLCSICMDQVENANHLFLECMLAKALIQKLGRWCDIDLSKLNSGDEMSLLLEAMHLSMNRKDILEAIIYTNWWSIWNFKNKCV